MDGLAPLLTHRTSRIAGQEARLQGRVSSYAAVGGLGHGRGMADFSAIEVEASQGQLDRV